MRQSSLQNLPERVARLPCYRQLIRVRSGYVLFVRLLPSKLIKALILMTGLIGNRRQEGTDSRVGYRMLCGKQMGCVLERFLRMVEHCNSLAGEVTEIRRLDTLRNTIA